MKDAVRSFADAFHVAAGHREAGTLDAAGRTWLPLARRVHTARARLLAQAPCPPAVRRRVEALFQAAPRTGAGWAELVFDSWSALAPAQRGPSTKRALEFRSAEVLLFVQLRTLGPEATRVHLAADVPDVTFHVRLDGSRARPRVLSGDEHGVGALRLGSAQRIGTISVFQRGAMLLQAAMPRDA